jgi:hypothetical protein
MTRTRLHNSEKKWKRATPEQKMESTLQRKLNVAIKFCNSYRMALELRKIEHQNTSIFLQKLLDDGRITKEEIHKFIPSKKEVIEKNVHKY